MCSLIRPKRVLRLDPRHQEWRTAYRYFLPIRGKLHAVFKNTSYGMMVSKTRVHRERRFTAHEVPTMTNRSGFHCYKEINAAKRDLGVGYLFMEVQISGTIVEYANGYRAQYMKFVVF